MLIVGVLGLSLTMNKKLNDWLLTQSEEFAKELKGKDVLGDGTFTLEELCELDNRFCEESFPVGDSND